VVLTPNGELIQSLSRRRQWVCGEKCVQKKPPPREQPVRAFPMAGLYCILHVDTEVFQYTTEVRTGSAATGGEDTGAADSQSNLRGNDRLYIDADVEQPDFS
jgi:hypothetical protein